jgi:drug/metabolite transporter (DMT)-like permease
VRIGWVKLEFNNLPLLITRGVFGALAVITYFYAIDHTALGRAVFFQFTYPAWGALFSTFFLKESMGWKRAPAFLLTFAGAFLILAFPKSGEAAVSTRAGDVAGLLCGFFSGAAVTAIRGLHRSDSTYMIFLFFSSFGLMLGAAMTFGPGNYVPPTPAQWAVVAGIAATGTAGQLFFTAGYRHLDVTAAGSMAMMQAPLSALAGFLWLGEALSPLAAAGAALVLCGGAILAATSRDAAIRPA